ncbi:hypothetical protein [Halosimplex salinum]|uniref:hypothetical protein n=1 Tax=Halosimplex salinum TaxID=1710538 RepID=UPI0013DE6AB4|nr:hypothetical protein [Halosimplex salinum]
MTRAIGPCRHCGARVPATTVCRDCGYDTDTERNRRDRFVWSLLGTLLVLSVVGAPVGLVLLWKASRHHRAMSGGVVAGDARPAPLSAAFAGARRRLTDGPQRRGGEF